MTGNAAHPDAYSQHQDAPQGHYSYFIASHGRY
jgi:hypothetical protein